MVRSVEPCTQWFVRADWKFTLTVLGAGTIMLSLIVYAALIH